MVYYSSRTSISIDYEVNNKIQGNKPDSKTLPTYLHFTRYDVVDTCRTIHGGVTVGRNLCFVIHGFNFRITIEISPSRSLRVWCEPTVNYQKSGRSMC